MPFGGACSEVFRLSDKPNFPTERVWGQTSEAGDSALPITCVSFKQAAQYCQWQGGSLPDLHQWQLAARGPDVLRYSWGDKTDDCGLHPGQHDPKNQNRVCGTSTHDFEVGQHPSGASAYGMQDMLLATGELLAVSSSVQFTPCQFGPGCFVTGTKPGAIDSVGSVKTEDAVPGNSSSFRCAFGGNSQ
jgi:hypothetical protein